MFLYLFQIKFKIQHIFVLTEQLKYIRTQPDVEMLNNANVPLGTSAPWTGQIIVTEEEPAGETCDAIIC